MTVKNPDLAKKLVQEIYTQVVTSRKPIGVNRALTSGEGAMLLLGLSKGLYFGDDEDRKGADEAFNLFSKMDQIDGLGLMTKKTRPAKIHDLKTLTDPFGLLWDRAKTCEVRKFDRDFRTGDHLMLHEWSLDGGYTGRTVTADITAITKPGTYGLTSDIGILSIKETARYTDGECQNFLKGV